VALACKAALPMQCPSRIAHQRTLKATVQYPDNGPCYISSWLKACLKDQDIEHTRGAPYHPKTQGKIERSHRSMKNVV